MKVFGLSSKKALSYLPKRNKRSNKNDYGRILIIGGTKGMSGAAILSAKSALKAGAGLVSVATIFSQQKIVATSLSEVLTLDLDETKQGKFSKKSLPQIKRWVREKGCDVVLIGPGFGVSREGFEIVRYVCKNFPCVVDADALNSLSKFSKTKNYGKIFAKPAIITPHPGEAARLLASTSSKINSNRQKSVSDIYNSTGAISVLKGNETLITNGKQIFKNPTGGPELAKAGTGDVLAGMIVGFWAQLGKQKGFDSDTAFESALLSVYVHGKCGYLAKKKFTSRGVLASELLSFLPKATKNK
jgi:hydroxyethylthiazole kinase-like uncharacterized protein yjeF